MNYGELLQLAKGRGNFVSDRIIIWRLRYKNHINAIKEIFKSIYADKLLDELKKYLSEIEY